ncbi:MAG: hypothetical protein CMJ76_16640 [Planctomycetaceae bacterium]|nr:hypothetical protein [Planctomycetaceae bacterium]
MQRRMFIKTGILTGVNFSTGCVRASSESQITPRTENGVDWYDVQSWGIEGRGFEDTDSYFDRLPKRAKGLVRDAVWNLSLHSAGMVVRFKTASPEIHVDYQLRSANLSMVHMPATGVSGIDFYGRTETGKDRWVQVVRPATQHVKTRVISGIDPGPEAGRLFTAYLPLYNGVKKLEIGVKSATRFTPVPPRTEKPILFYGTSIMHGACASRPGMSISALLGRRYNLPTVNLGFSGNGRLEMELADLIGEIDAAVYCIDCLPNLNPQQVKERTVPFFKRLRNHRPDTPIVMVEDRWFTNSQFFADTRSRHKGNQQAFREGYQQLLKEGVGGLHYLKGLNLLGDDGEAATDGSHPNDLGFMRYAQMYSKVLDPLLK